jgi:putative hemolysin
MTFAIVAGFKAFFKQAKSNVVASAKSICEKNGYEVNPAKKPEEKKSK